MLKILQKLIVKHSIRTSLGEVVYSNLNTFYISPIYWAHLYAQKKVVYGLFVYRLCVPMCLHVRESVREHDIYHGSKSY